MQDKNFEFFFLSQVKLKQIKEMFVFLHLFANLIKQFYSFQ